jgi:hypothetical protein
MSLKLVFFCPGTYTALVKFRLRNLLFWLLFIGLPLQGFAWGQMPSCGNQSQGVEVSSSQTFSMSAGNAMSMTVENDAPANSPVGCNPSDTPMMHCVSSTACAAAIPLSTVLLTVTPSLMAATPLSSLRLADIGFFTGAPERPPRPTAA